MSEEKKISNYQSETSNKPEDLKNKIAQETSANIISQPETTNPKPETENMEVHKHPHHVTHKKKWPEYLLEFLMIFLAVFLGFVAENIREHSVENHRERQYIVSLIEDLKEDSRLLEIQVDEQKMKLTMMDSLAIILTDPSLVAKSGDQLYYFGRFGPRIRTFSANVRTFEQLKNSGNFRLITNAETSNRIMTYYEKLPAIQQMESIMDNELIDFKKLAVQIFEPAVFMEQKTETFRTNNNPPLQNTNPGLLKQLAVYVIYMNGSRKAILHYDTTLLEEARKLILYLQKEYHTEK